MFWTQTPQSAREISSFVFLFLCLDFATFYIFHVLQGKVLEKSLKLSLCFSILRV